MNIRSMIENIQKEKNGLTGDYQLKEFFIKYGFIFSIGAGIISLFHVPFVGIPLLGYGVSLLVSKENNYDKYCNKIARLNKEEQHLCNIANNGVDTSERAKANRRQKLQAISNIKREKESALGISKATSALLNIGIAAATIAGIAIPGPLSFITPALAVAKIYKDKDKFDKMKEVETLTAQKNNLEREQMIANHSGQNRMNQQRTRQEQVKQNKEPVKTNKTVKKPVYSTSYATAYEPIYQASESKGAYQKVRR